MDVQILANLTRDYLVPAQPGSTLTQIVSAHADPGCPPETLLAILADNPLYQHFILGQRILARKIADWSDEDPNRTDREAFLSRRIIGLMGKTAVRNLVAAIQLQRSTGHGLPKKKGDAPDLQPQKSLAFALKAESVCELHGRPYPEMAFVGGYHYDALGALLDARKAPREAKEELKKGFLLGLEIAKLATSLALRFREVRYQKYVFAAALVLPIGRCLQSAAALKDASDALEFTGLMVTAMDFLREVEAAIRFAETPWMLVSSPPELYLLARILNVAMTLSEIKDFRLDTKIKLSEGQKAWLKTQRLGLPDLRQILLKLKEASHAHP